MAMALVSPDSIPHIHNHPIWHNLIHSTELHSAHFHRALNWMFFIDLQRNMFHWNFQCAELSSTAHFWTKLCHTKMWRSRGRYFVVPTGGRGGHHVKNLTTSFWDFQYPISSSSLSFMRRPYLTWSRLLPSNEILSATKHAHCSPHISKYLGVPNRVP